MSEDKTAATENGENRDKGRVPLACPVRLRFRRFQEFLQEVSANISIGGMFIATTEPHEPGSQFDFELALEDGFTLVKGRAEVVWVRPEAQGLNQPAGMGVRFLSLEGASRKLIAKVVEKYRRKGRQPFHLGQQGEPTATAEQAARVGALDGAGSGAAGVDTRGAAAAREERGTLKRILRYAGLALVAALAGLLIVLVFHHLYVRPRIDELERRLENLSARRVSVAAEAAESIETEPESARLDETLSPRQRVAEWARAWSGQRVDDYLEFYSPRFQPDGGMSREAWAAMRRTRILRHSNIRVQILLAEQVELADDEVEVSFVQAYHSDSYHDRVRKTLRLVREEGVWKIAEERVVRAVPD